MPGEHALVLLISKNFRKYLTSHYHCCQPLSKGYLFPI
jgi:hypothetical protein